MKDKTLEQTLERLEKILEAEFYNDLIYNYSRIEKKKVVAEIFEKTKQLLEKIDSKTNFYEFIEEKLSSKYERSIVNDVYNPNIDVLKRIYYCLPKSYQKNFRSNLIKLVIDATDKKHYYKSYALQILYGFKCFKNEDTIKRAKNKLEKLIIDKIKWGPGMV